MNEELVAKNLYELEKIIRKVEKNKNKINKILDNKKKVNKIKSNSLDKIHTLQEDIKELKNSLRKTKKNANQEINFSKKSDDFTEQVSETRKVIEIMNNAIEKQNMILKLTKDKK